MGGALQRAKVVTEEEKQERKLKRASQKMALGDSQAARAMAQVAVAAIPKSKRREIGRAGGIQRGKVLSKEELHRISMLGVEARRRNKLLREAQIAEGE